MCYWENNMFIIKWSHVYIDTTLCNTLFLTIRVTGLGCRVC